MLGAVVTLIALTLPAVRTAVALEVGVVGTPFHCTLMVHEAPAASVAPQLPGTPVVTRTITGTSAPRVVAVDLPSGVNAETGEADILAPWAELTVTFGCPKRGHFLFPGAALTGRVRACGHTGAGQPPFPAPIPGRRLQSPP